MDYLHFRTDYKHFYNHDLDRYMTCSHADCLYCATHNHKKFAKAVSAIAPHKNLDLAIINHLKPDATKFIKAELTKLLNSKRYQTLKHDYEFKELVIAEAHAKGDIHLNIYFSTKKNISDLRSHPVVNSLLTDLYLHLQDFELTTIPLNADSIKIINAYNDAINPVSNLYAHKIFNRQSSIKDKAIQLTINNGKRYLYYRRGFFKTSQTNTQKDAYKQTRTIELKTKELMIDILGSVDAYENINNWLTLNFYNFYKNNPQHILSHLSKVADLLKRLPENSALKKSIRTQIQNDELTLGELDRNLTKIIELRKQIATYYKAINETINATNLNTQTHFEKIAPSKFSIKAHKRLLRSLKAIYKNRNHLRATKTELEQFFNAINKYENKFDLTYAHERYIAELTNLLKTNRKQAINDFLKHLYKTSTPTNNSHCIYIVNFKLFLFLASATFKNRNLIIDLTYDLIYKLYPRLE